jgi:SanA protein
MRWVRRTLFVAVSFAFLFLGLSNVWVVSTTRAQVIMKMADLPDHRVALVLGTSHKLAGGTPNPFFENRMNTAAELFSLGKVDHFILSGDNRSRYYNEPVEMRKALLARGVPATAITLDYAGLRTLDSIVRSKEIFGQTRLTIITQSFHSYRALFISNYYNIDAVAMATADAGTESAAKVYLREYLARSKAVLDLYILKTSPRFMGQKENLPIGS